MHKSMGNGAVGQSAHSERVSKANHMVWLLLYMAVSLFLVFYPMNCIVFFLTLTYFSSRI